MFAGLSERKMLTLCFFLQIAFTFLVYPALILAYMGQAAYLSKHHNSTHQIGFYVSVPGMSLYHLQKFFEDKSVVNFT